MSFLRKFRQSLTDAANIALSALPGGNVITKSLADDSAAFQASNRNPLVAGLKGFQSGIHPLNNITDKAAGANAQFTSDRASDASDKGQVFGKTAQGVALGIAQAASGNPQGALQVLNNTQSLVNGLQQVKADDGAEVSGEGVTVNIEGGELLVSPEGTPIMLFDAPPHPKDGTLDPAGTRRLPENHYVVPKDKVTWYLDNWYSGNKKKTKSYLEQLPGAKHGKKPVETGIVAEQTSVAQDGLLVNPFYGASVDPEKEKAHRLTRQAFFKLYETARNKELGINTDSLLFNTSLTNNTSFTNNTGLTGIGNTKSIFGSNTTGGSAGATDTGTAAGKTTEGGSTSATFDKKFTDPEGIQSTSDLQQRLEKLRQVYQKNMRTSPLEYGAYGLQLAAQVGELIHDIKRKPHVFRPVGESGELRAAYNAAGLQQAYNQLNRSLDTRAVGSSNIAYGGGSRLGSDHLLTGYMRSQEAADQAIKQEGLRATVQQQQQQQQMQGAQALAAEKMQLGQLNQQIDQANLLERRTREAQIRQDLQGITKTLQQFAAGEKAMQLSRVKADTIQSISKLINLTKKVDNQVLSVLETVAPEVLEKYRQRQQKEKGEDPAEALQKVIRETLSERSK